MAKIEDVLTEVQKNNSLSQSIIAALQTTRDQLSAAIANLPPDNQAELQSILDQLQTTDQQLAAAVIANTPAAGGTPASAIVKNDGPTEAAKDSPTGMVPPTTGTDTAGVTGVGADQAPKTS